MENDQKVSSFGVKWAIRRYEFCDTNVSTIEYKTIERFAKS